MNHLSARTAMEAIIEGGGSPLDGNHEPSSSMRFLEFAARRGADGPMVLARVFDELSDLREHLGRCSQSDDVRSNTHGCDCAGVLAVFAISGKIADGIRDDMGAKPVSVSEFRRHVPEFNIILPASPPRRGPVVPKIQFRIEKVRGPEFGVA